ncbi:hypothetical protein ACKVEX_03230 [Rhodocyclaceae bacterium SMB388]
MRRGLRKVLLCCWLTMLSSAAVASVLPARVEVCFDYGCLSEAEVLFDEGTMSKVKMLLGSSSDAAAEREALARVLGELYRAAGAQSPIHADRAGNLLDAGVAGRMDCIDHSTTTSRFLNLIEERAWLRFHRVRDPARRQRLIFQHFSAVIEELEADLLASTHSPGMVPDHVPILLALCDCEDVLDDLPRPAGGTAETPPRDAARFAVDSWFVDHGEPAIVLPLAEWLRGGGPNVY